MWTQMWTQTWTQTWRQIRVCLLLFELITASCFHGYMFERRTTSPGSTPLSRFSFASTIDSPHKYTSVSRRAFKEERRKKTAGVDRKIRYFPDRLFTFFPSRSCPCSNTEDSHVTQKQTKSVCWDICVFGLEH